LLIGSVIMSVSYAVMYPPVKEEKIKKEKTFPQPPSSEYYEVQILGKNGAKKAIDLMRFHDCDCTMELMRKDGYPVLRVPEHCIDCFIPYMDSMYTHSQTFGKYFY